jgi:hypothetical protein
MTHTARRSLAPLLAAAVVFAGAAGVGAQPAVTVQGDCNITQIAVGSANARMELPGTICFARDKPDKVLRVMYYWLDPISASFLIGRRIDPSLQRLLGQTPITLPTAALADATDLVNRFGSAVDDNPSLLGGTLSVSVQAGQKSARLKKQAAEKIPKSFTRGLKIYDALDAISIPDVEAYQALASPDRWPARYAALFCAKGKESSWNEDSIRDSLVLWRFAKREDIADYAGKVRAIMTMFRAGGLKPVPADAIRYGEFVSELGREKGAVEEPQDIARAEVVNKDVEAMLYVTRDAWPDDFLLIMGTDHEGCGAFFSFDAVPREFFLQVAVLENTSTTTPIPLSAIRVQQAGNTALRTPEADGEWKEDALAFPPGILRPGERLVIPMRIDFRQPKFDKQKLAERYEPARSQAMYDTLRRKFTRLELTTMPDKKNAIYKKAAAFPAPTAPAITPSYVYGHRLSLVSATSGGVEIPLRPYNAASIFTVAEFETGSCPFLYARYDDDPEFLKVGRIFRAASSPARAVTFERTFDKSLNAIVIAEEEAEITTIRRLTLIARDRNGTVLARVGRENLRLGFGARLVLEAPRAAGAETYTLTAEGYYDPLGAIVAEMTRR